LKIGDKVKVKSGLGMISGHTGYIIAINGEKAVVDFPYYDIKEIYLEDLTKIKK